VEKIAKLINEDVQECSWPWARYSLLFNNALISDSQKTAEKAKKRGFGDAYTTLFVARLGYKTEMKDLERGI